MASRKCDVVGCEDKLRSPRLCNKHTIEWFSSPEETETRKRFNFVEPYQRWLQRVSEATSGSSRPH